MISILSDDKTETEKKERLGRRINYNLNIDNCFPFFSVREMIWMLILFAPFSQHDDEMNESVWWLFDVVNRGFARLVNAC